MFTAVGQRGEALARGRSEVGSHHVAIGLEGREHGLGVGLVLELESGRAVLRLPESHCNANDQ